MGKFKNPQTITSTHSKQEDFGFSVAIHNGYVVVGDPYKDGGSPNQGEVHVFRLERGEFRLLQDIKSPNRDHNIKDDNFGASVAIHDGYIVVGAPYDDHPSPGDTDYGYVYVYRLERGEFRLLQQIRNPDKGSPDEDDFGNSVAIHDGYIVVGARSDNGNSGSVYVYRLERGEFKHHQRIPNPGSVNDYFGTSVAIHDGYIVVNTSYTGASDNSFYVYRLERGEFKHHQSIQKPGTMATTSVFFGTSVAIHDGYIVLGNYNDNTLSGSVHIYRLERGEFKHHQIIPNPESNDTDLFGLSVAIHDGYIVVGAYADDNPSNNEGSAYVYRLDNGKFRNPQKLESPDKEQVGEFGYSVAIHDGRVVVGQPYDLRTGGTPKPGSAYIFSYGY